MRFRPEEAKGNLDPVRGLPQFLNVILALTEKHPAPAVRKDLFQLSDDPFKVIRRSVHG